MNKRRIAALLLCIPLIFSGGCSLIDIDQEKVDAIENAKVLAEYKDTDITKQQLVQYMSQNLAQQGTTLEDVQADETYWKSYLDSALNELVVNEIAMEKAIELGFDQLTEDENKQIDDEYNNTVDSIKSYVDYIAKAAVEDDPTKNYDEEYQNVMAMYFDSLGFTQESYRDEVKKKFILKKVYDDVIKDIVTTDEEVKENYDSQITIQQGNLKSQPSFVEMQEQIGSKVLVYPEGYMNVRHIYLAFDDETKSAATTAFGEDNTSEYDKLIGDGKAALKTKIDDIQSRLSAGEDFGKLMEEYNEDSSYSIEPYSTEGTEIGPYKSIDNPGYLDAVAKLTKEGQVSEPLVNYNGVYFIQCVKLLAGVVPYDDVKEEMTANMLAGKQSTEWSTVTKGWTDEAKSAGVLKMYPERY